MTDPDVVVVGAGSAGVAAAVAAAEGGAQTILLEASEAIGGTLAWQLLEHGAGFHEATGTPVVGGVGARLVEALVGAGSSPGHVRDDTGYTSTRTPVNHAELPLVEAEMLAESGVSLWLRSALVDVRRDGSVISGLVVQTPAGRRDLHPGVVVDCSGDAVAATLAGAAFLDDGGAERQPLSLLFKLGNVDFETLLGHARAHPDLLRGGSHLPDPGAEVVNLWGFGRLLLEGHESGELSLRRTEMHLAGWPPRRELIVNVTRVRGTAAAGADEGEAYLALSHQILELVRWFRRRMPGCAGCYLAQVAGRVGVRESRRVRGRVVLSAPDVRTGRRFPDVVGRGAFPIDIHAASGAGLAHAESLATSYGIPYGALCADGLDNLLVGGRAISSTHEANGSVRITGTCFVTGEAAGCAAACAVRDQVAVHRVDVGRLQEALRGRGAILSAP